MLRTSGRRSSATLLFVAALAASINCSSGGGGGGGGGGTNPPVLPTMVVNAGDNQSAPYGTAVTTAPSVIVRNSAGAGVAGTAVTFAIASGGGSITGASTTTNSSGIATVGSWTVGATLGTNTLTAAATGVTGSPVTFTATSTAGPATTIAVNAGNNQTATAGTAVAIAPSVKVTDAGGNAVTGTSVTFAVASGGGNVTGGTQTTNSSGIATVGGWTLGSAGANTMTATSAGLTGSPLTFTATATAPSPVSVTAVSPSLLTPGISATVTGNGFSTTPASNGVTIDGVAATVTAATATQLTITVPTTLACDATHDASIVVTVAGNSGSTTKALQVATQQSLGIGQSVIITDPTKIRCNELTTTTGGHFYIDVYNTNTTYSTTGASFQVRGVAASGTAGTGAVLAGAASSSRNVPAAQLPLMSNARLDAYKLAAARRPTTIVDNAQRAHSDLLDANIRFLQQHRTELMARRTTPRANRTTVPLTVGATVSGLHVPNLNNTTNICLNNFTITGRVVYVGTKSIVIEDNANPLAGTIDSTYIAIGQEFDNTMYPILTTNFGDPLAIDASTDNNQREIMVFTNVVNVNMPNLAGFVVTCDLSAPTATNTQSNLGEYFYAMVPTVSGNISVAHSPPNWRWTMRATIIHESKHLASFAERIARSASAFETSWLEETTARISEEIYDRTGINSQPSKANLPYGSNAVPGIPYCDVRPNGFPACAGKPRGIVRVFEELASQPSTSAPTNPNGWYRAPEDHSPLGRIDANDFSFYSTGWSLVRWSIDNTSALTESAFLKALTTETSLTGLANLQARTGRTFADMQPEWSLAMVVDDLSGFTPTLTTLKQPSWNFRDVFVGLKADFSTYYATTFPLVAFTRAYGTFTVDYHVLPGTASFIELSGAQITKQLIELKAASPSTANAPSELRIAIVRVP